MPSGALLVGAAVLLTGAVGLAVAAWRARRAILRYGAEAARMPSDWTVVPGVAGAAPLRLHARVSVTPPGTALPPAVLVHGFGIGTGYLVPLAARLADHTHVYAPDLPGHGASDHDARPLTVIEHAAGLAAWMDIDGLHSAVLVGHSLGCQIAAEVASRRPDLVCALVLVGPTSDPAARSTVRQLTRAAASVIFERPGLWVWAAIDYTRAGVRVLATELRQMMAHRLEDVLPRLGVPVRIVRGGRDRIASQRWARTVARLTGAPPPTVIDSWGHSVHYDDPDAVARIVLELARTVRPAVHTVHSPA